jgi:hypothetical protein
VRIRVSVAVCCAAMCVSSGVALASASGSGRVYSMRFSASCANTGSKLPLVAPHVLGALARVTVPTAWHTIRVSPNTSPSGGGCAQPSLLTEPRGDADLCVQETVYASVSRAGTKTPAHLLGDEAAAVVARGVLPTVSGMRGVWAEVNVGVTPAYPTYEVDAAYESADRKAFYELSVDPPESESGCPAGSGSLARAVARQLATSFRIDVTDPATAEALS